MVVARRYANSLMELATETRQVDTVRQDMKLIASVCAANRDLMLMLNSPVIKTDKKVSVLESVFAQKVSPLSLTFMILMSKKHRESYLKDIAIEFEEQYKQKKNILTAVVTSANGLDKATREKMLDLVKSQTKGEVELIEKVDPSAIGGFILRIGDRQIDRSVSRQLSNLKKNFINKN